MSKVCAIFDLDGTLIDSRRDLATAINLTRADYGLEPLSLEIITSYIGNGTRKLCERAFPAGKYDLDNAIALFKKSPERSSAIAHLTNVSIRAGREVTEDRLKNRIKDNAMLNTIVSEQAAQLKDWGIDKPKYTLGKNLRIDPKAAQVTTEGVESLIRLKYRKEFTVPELV